MRSKAITLYIAFIALVTGLFSCSEWDTDSLGSKFVPANSQVRNFKRQVFVEYSPHSARVWGEAADLVESNVEDCHVSLKFEKDSIAIFVYGYTTADTTQVGGDASLTIRANTKTGYALYLNGTSIYNPHGPAIQSLGNNACYIVLSSNTRNNLTTVAMDGVNSNADASLYCEGNMVVTGTGTLNVSNIATDANRSNSISAYKFGCTHNATVNLRSEAGHNILVQDEMAISSGKWDMISRLSNIKTRTALLTSGTYNAHCTKGSFIETFDKFSMPAILRSPTITSLASHYTNYADSAIMAGLGYIADSLYYPKQYKPEFELLKDSTYTIYYRRDTVDQKLSTFKPSVTIPDGYLLISNSSLKNRDKIFVTK